MPLAPTEFQQADRRRNEKWAKVIRKANLKPA